MSGRSHPKCWDEATQAYTHHCHKQSGRTCIEKGCQEPAGTPWGPYLCPPHDVERLDRVTRGFQEIAASLATGADS